MKTMLEPPEKKKIAFRADVAEALRAGFGYAEEARIDAMEKAIWALKADGQLLKDLMDASKQRLKGDDMVNVLRTFLGLKPVSSFSGVYETSPRLLIERMMAVNKNFTARLEERELPGGLIFYNVLVANKLPIFDVKKSLREAGTQIDPGVDVIDAYGVIAHSDHTAYGILYGYGTANARAHQTMTDKDFVRLDHLFDLIRCKPSVPEEMLYAGSMVIYDFEDKELAALAKISKMVFIQIDREFARFIGESGRRWICADREIYRKPPLVVTTPEELSKAVVEVVGKAFQKPGESMKEEADRRPDNFMMIVKRSGFDVFDASGNFDERKMDALADEWDKRVPHPKLD